MDALSYRRRAALTAPGLLLLAASFPGCGGPTLEPSVAVSGIVIDQSSRAPLAGVTIVAHAGNATLSVQADAAGGFRIPGLPSGSTVTLTAAPIGYESRTIAVVARVNTTLSMELVLLPPIEFVPLPDIFGTVTENTSSGRVPLPSVEIDLLDQPYKARSNDAGEYSLPDVPFGNLMIRATKLGYRTHTGPLVISENTRYDVELVRNVLSGRVVERTPDGLAPLTGAYVGLSEAGALPPSDGFEPCNSTSTDGSGTYRIAAPTDTRLPCRVSPFADLHVYKAGYVPINIRIPIDGDTRLEIEMVRIASGTSG